MKKNPNEPNMFDLLRQIFFKTKNHKYNKKILNAYMMTMWLSHDPSIINIVHEMNKIQFTSGLPDDIIYLYYFYAIPKKNRFLKWTKKDKVDKKRKTVLEKIAEKRNVSMREAEYILSLMERIKK